MKKYGMFKEGECGMYYHNYLTLSNQMFCYKSMTYIRVTGLSIFQPHSSVGACVTRLTPAAPFMVYTQNGDSA